MTWGVNKRSQYSNKQPLVFETLGSHDGDSEDDNLLGYGAM
jgi:hypothetical protein